MADAQTTVAKMGGVSFKDLYKSYKAIVTQFPKSQEKHPLFIIAECAHITATMFQDGKTWMDMTIILNLVSKILDIEWINSRATKIHDLMFNIRSIAWTSSKVCSCTIDASQHLLGMENDIEEECIKLCNLVKHLLVPYEHLFVTPLPPSAIDSDEINMEIKERNSDMIRYREEQQASLIEEKWEVLEAEQIARMT